MSELKLGSPASAPSGGLPLLAVIWTAFFSFGLLFGALGPSLQELAQQTGSTLAQIGLISSLTFIGGLVVQSVAGVLVDRLGPLPLLLASAVLIGLGTFGITTGTVLLIVLAVAFVSGMGHGLLDTSGQIVAATAFPQNAFRALNSVHLCFAIGTMVGPAVASYTLSTWGTAIPAMQLGAVLFLAITPLLWWMNRRVNLKPAAPASQSDASQPSASVTARLYRSPLLWALGIVILFYVGIETGVGNWTSVYMQRSADYTPADAALAVSWYWAAFTLSRLLATIISGRIKPHAMMLGTLMGTLCGALLLIVGAGNGTLTIAATFMLGFFFGPAYPTIMSLATTTFTHAPGKAASLVVALGSIGGTIIPWLHGAGLERLTSWHIVYVMGISLAMFAAYLAVRYFDQAHQQVMLTEQVAVGEGGD